MRSYEQLAKDILTKRDALLYRRKQRRKTVRLCCAAVGCAAVTVLSCTALLHTAPLPPVPSDDSSQTDTGHKTDAQGGATSVTAPPVSSPSTTQPTQGDTTHTAGLFPGDRVVCNEIARSAAARILFPDTVQPLQWTLDEVCAYYDWETSEIPLFETLPAGLQAVGDRSTETFTVYRDQSNGSFFMDSVSFSCVSGFYPAGHELAGQPILPMDGGGELCVSVTRREAFFRDYRYGYDEPPQTSRIAGTEVTIGHARFGSYYNEEHVPQVEWDFYTATFRKDGVLYEWRSENLPFEVLYHAVHDYLT